MKNYSSAFVKCLKWGRWWKVGFAGLVLAILTGCAGDAYVAPGWYGPDYYGYYYGPDVYVGGYWGPYGYVHGHGPYHGGYHGGPGFASRGAAGGFHGGGGHGGGGHR